MTAPAVPAPVDLEAADRAAILGRDAAANERARTCDLEDRRRSPLPPELRASVRAHLRLSRVLLRDSGGELVGPAWGHEAQQVAETLAVIVCQLDDAIQDLDEAAPAFEAGHARRSDNFRTGGDS